MNFKEYLKEAVIVPPKLDIKTNDINKLNKQFKDTIISFEYDTGDHAAYLPDLNKIKVFITKETPLNVIESLVQHELIHQIQDKKSRSRMQADIEKQYQAVQGYLNDIEDFEDDDEIPQAVTDDLYNKIKKAQIKAQHLNDEERMTYAMVFVKLRGSDNIKDVIKDANKKWLDFTNQKMNKKMLKYFYSYWLVRDKL